MTRSDAGLEATRAALKNMEDALRTDHAEKDKYHPSWYAALTEPVIDQIRTPRAELDAAIGRPAAAQSPAAGSDHNRSDPAAS